MRQTIESCDCVDITLTLDKIGINKYSLFQPVFFLRYGLSKNMTNLTFKLKCQVNFFVFPLCLDSLILFALAIKKNLNE